MSDLADILFAAGLPTAVLFYLLLFPDKFERLAGMLGGALYAVSVHAPKIRTWADKQDIAYSIQGVVNGVGEKLNRQAPDIVPHTLKVQWVRPEEAESFIEKGSVVVRLSHRNRDKNLVTATLAYLRTGFLPNAKVFMDARLRRASEYKIAADIFRADSGSGTYQYFVDNELEPMLATVPELEKDWQMLHDLDEKGFFTHVFLRELQCISDKLLRTFPSSPVREEIRGFANFLRVIVTKALREDVPLEFSGSAVRVAVVLVARSHVMHRHGIDPYVRRIELNTRAGYEYIFVVGWGAEYAEQVVSIRATIPRSIVTVLNAYTLSWQGRQATAALLVCQSNVSYLARIRELQQEVMHALRLSIPQIESEQVQVAKIARELGVGCKVAVRSLNVGDKIDPVSACIGEDGNLASEVCRRLGGEYISFVYWDEDPKTFIANALYPLRGDHIDGIDVDDASLVAYVRVQNKYAAQRAVGKNGVNVGLASQLTGYQLFIEGPLVSDPEDQLRQ